MEIKQFLSISENRSAVESISRLVLADVAPDEVEKLASFVEPWIDTIAEGKVITNDTSNEAGGFGLPDMWTPIVVSAVCAVLTNLVIHFGVTGVKELQRKWELEQAKRLIKEVTDQYHHGGRKNRKFTNAVEKKVVDYVDSIDEERKYLADLRQKLVKYFSESELRDLCHDLRVDVEVLGLPAEITKGDIARQLVAYLERRNQIAKLVDMCRQERPEISW